MRLDAAPPLRVPLEGSVGHGVVGGAPLLVVERPVLGVVVCEDPLPLQPGDDGVAIEVVIVEGEGGRARGGEALGVVQRQVELPALEAAALVDVGEVAEVVLLQADPLRPVEVGCLLHLVLLRGARLAGFRRRPRVVEVEVQEHVVGRRHPHACGGIVHVKPSQRPPGQRACLDCGRSAPEQHGRPEVPEDDVLLHGDDIVLVEVHRPRREGSIEHRLCSHLLHRCLGKPAGAGALELIGAQRPVIVDVHAAKLSRKVRAVHQLHGAVQRIVRSQRRLGELDGSSRGVQHVPRAVATARHVILHVVARRDLRHRANSPPTVHIVDAGLVRVRPALALLVDRKGWPVLVPFPRWILCDSVPLIPAAFKHCFSRCGSRARCPSVAALSGRPILCQ
mmetsp:Transcript_40718/g.95781  ORF Transcript_40718/g.95781 Transcript_40718/m.95781 type:complete len:393 (-) Transcript_40718:258-1436(-)